MHTRHYVTEIHALPHSRVDSHNVHVIKLAFLTGIRYSTDFELIKQCT